MTCTSTYSAACIRRERVVSATRPSRAEEVTIEVVAKHSSVDANPRHPPVAIAIAPARAAAEAKQ
jgi:hypothetical protein